MNATSYNEVLTVNQNPGNVIAAIANVHAWWSTSIVGGTALIGDRCTHRERDLDRCDLQVDELIQNQRIGWLALDNYFNSTQGSSERKGTKVVIELSVRDVRTDVHFTHLGMMPECDCCDACKDGWDTDLQSLRSLIPTGTGHPYVREAITSVEIELMRTTGDVA